MSRTSAPTDIHGREIPKSLPGFSNNDAQEEAQNSETQKNKTKQLLLHSLGLGLIAILGYSLSHSRSTMPNLQASIPSLASLSAKFTRTIPPKTKRSPLQTQSSKKRADHSAIQIKADPDANFDFVQLHRETLQELKTDRQALEAILPRVFDSRERDHLHATISELKEAEAQLRIELVARGGHTADHH